MPWKKCRCTPKSFPSLRDPVPSRLPSFLCLVYTVATPETGVKTRVGRPTLSYRLPVMSRVFAVSSRSRGPSSSVSGGGT